MQIWLINPYGPIPGEGWRDYRFTMLGGALAKHGHRVTWWTSNFSHQFKRFRSQSWSQITVAPGFEIRLVPTPAYYKNISLNRAWFETAFAWRVYHRAKLESPPDFIVGADPPQSSGYVAVKLAKHFGARLVLDVMDLWPEIYALALPSLLRPLAPALFLPFSILRRYDLRRADAVTAVCDTYLKLVQHEAPHLTPASSMTVFIGVDVAALRGANLGAHGASVELAHKMGKRSGDVWAIYPGTLGNNYDIEALLQAAAQLEARRSAVKILIAGDGPLRQHITDFVEMHQLTNLTYVGTLDLATLEKYYQVCDVGLSPYAAGSTVAMPLKVYDYLAAGLPIVNSLQGELEAFLRDRQIGIQYVAGNPKSLADALEYMATDGERRREMACNSYEAAMQFDQRAQCDKFVELVERL